MRTPFYEINRSLGARFTDFHGWEMPLQFGGTIREVTAVRESAGVFDISHMGRIEVSGKGSFELIQRLTTNDLSKLSPGRVQYTLFTNERGGVLDDATIYMIDEERYFVCVNAANKDKILGWLLRHKREGAEVQDLSDRLVQIALQGPKSPQIIKSFYEADSLGYYRFGIFGSAIVSRTGYTGSDGFEIYLPPEEGKKLYSELVKLAEPCGLGARDVLRIEAGFPLYGNELSEDITPLHARLERFVSIEKEFIGKDALLNLKPERILMGLKMEGKGIPRKGYKVYRGDRVIGEVSSGTYSPTLKSGIALCFIDTDHAIGGISVSLKIRDKLHHAVLTGCNFLKKS